MSPKHAFRACPICENREVEVLQHEKFVLPEGHLLPDEYDVVWCARCGIGHADTPASQEDYDRYYAEFSKYEDDTTSTGGGGSSWDSERLKVTAAAVDRMVPNRVARMVDIGCANGGLLAELKERGFTNLLGIDPSAACVANTKGHGIEAMVGSFRALPVEIGKFDVVLVSHVLEHVADLRSTVSDLAKLLQPDGLLYVEVPDASRYLEFLVAPFQDFNTEHINHFALSSLRNLFLPRGFSFAAGGQKEIASSFHESLQARRKTPAALAKRGSSPRLRYGPVDHEAARGKRTRRRGGARSRGWQRDQPREKIRGISVPAPEEVAGDETPIRIATLLHKSKSPRPFEKSSSS